VTLKSNDGTRPSRLELGRLATGECSDAEAEDIRGRMTGEDEAYLEALDASRAALPPMDFQAIERRASEPQVSNNNRWLGWAVGLAIAAIALIVLLPQLARIGGEDSGLRARGSTTLVLYQQQGAEHVQWAGQPLAAGATLGFQILGLNEKAVTLLDIDDLGQIQVVYPLPGDPPLKKRKNAHLIPTSWTLDASEATREFFVLAVNMPTQSLMEQTQALMKSGGLPAVQEWVDEMESLTGIMVPRK